MKIIFDKIKSVKLKSKWGEAFGFGAFIDYKDFSEAIVIIGPLAIEIDIEIDEPSINPS